MRPFAFYEKINRKNATLPAIQAKLFLKDPLVASQPKGVGIDTVTIEGEVCVGTGPTSSRIAVVDYNGELDTLFEGARLNHTGKSFVLHGNRDPRKNFHFHQVHVWAVIHKTLELLEAPDVFGRQIPWAFPGGRLVVLPHAGYWENAYYDRDTGALHFFYFESATTGEPIYTCLSHDIVAHELGHAVLDGLKPYYNEVTSAQTAGFHEYFGDAVALTAALNHKRIIVKFAGEGNADLSVNNIISNIAAEFGQGLDPQYGSIANAYLRNANNQWTMSDLEGEFEEHELSKVPTGAYYELLRAVFTELIRLKKRDQGNHRVAALIDAARVTRRMMLRALDYCPPVDLQYADYAQAVLRADRVAFPHDSSGFRAFAAQIFEKRQLIVNAEADDEKLAIYNDQLRGLDIDTIAASRTDAYRFLDRNRSVFNIPPEANVDVINLYRTKKLAANDFRVPQEIVVEFVWQEEIHLTEDGYGPLKETYFPLWCGGTIVFSREGNLLHHVIKRNTGERRKLLSDYVKSLVRSGDLTFDHGESGLGAHGVRHSRYIASIDGRRARLRRNAAMRHRREGTHGMGHGDD